jgi:hypothetical protein
MAINPKTKDIFAKPPCWLFTFEKTPKKTAADFAVICYYTSFWDDSLISLLHHNFSVRHFVFTNCRKLESKGLGLPPMA